MKKKPRLLMTLAGLVAIAGIGLSIWAFRDHLFPASTQAEQNKTQPTSEPQAPQLRFAAMGDMLAHDSVVANAKMTDGYDFTQYFTRVRYMYKNADVVFCNPETLAAGPAFGISGYPAFNAPTEFPRDLNRVGCNLINLATNHISDKSQAAVNATLDVWGKLPVLAVAGANRDETEQQTVRYFTKNGIKVAFVAFADFTNKTPAATYSVTLYHDTALVTKLLTEARKNADFVVVSAHWGTEDSGAVNADQEKAAKLFASLGADVVIGTGPHVLQKASTLPRTDGGTTLVWYSIGNMLSSQLKVDELTGGVAGFVVTKKDGKAVVSDISFYPTFMSYDWPAAQKAAGNLAARTNLALYPLGDAEQAVSKFGTTVEERVSYVHRTIGGEAPVSISP